MDSIATILATFAAQKSQSNRLAEKIIRTLLEKARFILDHGRFEKVFCDKAIKHSTDSHNKTATPELKMETTAEALLGKIPDSTRLRIFGYET